MAKRTFVSEKQKALLIDIMENDEELKKGKFTNTFTHKTANDRWDSIAVQLNAIPGACKNGIMWRKDLKKNIKKKNSERRQHTAGTGGGPPLPNMIFSSAEEKLMNILGETAVQGHPDITESIVEIVDSQDEMKIGDTKDWNCRPLYDEGRKCSTLQVAEIVRFVIKEASIENTYQCSVKLNLDIMAYFVISGNSRCPGFVHAIHVARYLNEKLPNFHFKKVEKLDLDWADYIYELNKENNWYIHKSPLIWKEINMWGGKKHLIGGLSEFWEYVYCYYGLESLIPKKEIARLAADNVKFFIEDQNVASKMLENVQNISILGACGPQTPVLIHNLIELDEIKKDQGIAITLYDCLGRTERKAMFMMECAEYANKRNIYGSRDIVTVVRDEEEAIKDADIIIHVEDFRRRESDSLNGWLERCYSRMNELSDVINRSDNRNLRIIMNNHGPVCFLATCLVEFCTRIKPSNIVAVTADEGLSVISVVSEKTGIPVEKISAPPVWGFVGLSSFVDERFIVFKADMYMPYKRAITAPISSTLPLGTIKTELRQISYMLPKDNNIAEEVERRKMKMNIRLDRPPILAKVRAVISLLKLWYSSDKSKGAIISLGVCSNGSFNIPMGLVFSQPVKMDHNRKWTPYSKFPLMNELTSKYTRKCAEAALQYMRLFRIDTFVETSEGDSMYTQYSEAMN